MFNHEPDGYACPFCQLVAGGEVESRVNTQQDIVRRTDLATAFISPRWWPTRPYAEFVAAERRRPYADRLREHFESAAPH